MRYSSWVNVQDVLSVSVVDGVDQDEREVGVCWAAMIDSQSVVY